MQCAVKSLRDTNAIVKQVLPKPWTYPRVQATVLSVHLLDPVNPDYLVKLSFIFFYQQFMCLGNKM